MKYLKSLYRSVQKYLNLVGENLEHESQVMFVKLIKSSPQINNVFVPYIFTLA